MNSVRLTTLDNQRQRLEMEILEAKQKIIAMTENACLNLGSVNQLRDQIERNMQLITMIEQHRPARVNVAAAKA